MWFLNQLFIAHKDIIADLSANFYFKEDIKILHFSVIYFHEVIRHHSFALSTSED